MNATGPVYFVRADVPACVPSGLPLLPQVAPIIVAVGVSFLARFGSFWYARLNPGSKSWCAREGKATAIMAAAGRALTFRVRVTSFLGVVTCSENWAMALARATILICNAVSITFAGVCFIQPLPIVCTALANVGIARVAFTMFVSKAHGIDAGLLALLLLFVVCNVSVSFLRFQPTLAVGTWQALIALVVFGFFAFFSYVGVVSYLKSHQHQLEAAHSYITGVTLASWYLVFAEFLLTGVVTATLLLVNTDSFKVALF